MLGLFCILSFFAAGVRNAPKPDLTDNIEQELLFLIGEGQLYVNRALRLAELHTRGAGAGAQISESLYELGGLRGKRPDMAERGLHRWVRRQVWGGLLPLSYDFDLPVKDRKRPGGTKPRVHSALLPHEVFSSIHATSRALFRELFCGPPGNLVEWWLKSADTEWCRRHPCHAEQSDASRRVPIGIHGDDAGTFFSEKVLVLSWNSVAVTLDTLDNRILFACADLNTCVDGVTLQELYRVMLWSFRALLRGRFPEADHNGEPFSKKHHPDRWRLRRRPLTAEGFIGAFSEVRGDWKWIYETFMFSQYYNAAWICHLCNAHVSIPHLLYTQFGQADALRETRYSHDEIWHWYFQRAPWSICVLVFIPGFHFWRVWSDALHTLDLGVLQCAVGSAMWELTAQAHPWPGKSRAVRLEHAYNEYKEWGKQHKLTGLAKPFDKNMFKKSKARYPRVSQLSMKAATLRGLTYWLYDVTSKNASDAHGHLMASMFLGFVVFDIICRSAGRFFTDEQKKHIGAYVEMALLCYNALAEEARLLRKALWKLVPKFHMFCHVAYDFAMQANPRRVHCYPDEDLVGKVKRIFSKCHGGSAGRRTLMRYVILVSMRWWLRMHALER